MTITHIYEEYSNPFEWLTDTFVGFIKIGFIIYWWKKLQHFGLTEDEMKSAIYSEFVYRGWWKYD